MPNEMRVQNAAAHLVFELLPKEHVTPCYMLLQLHWLPVCWRVQFKLCCIMHSIFRGNSSEYLTNTVRSVCASRYQHLPPTIHCLAYGPNSASVLSHTLVPQLGTHCRRTFVPHHILLFLEDSSKLIISA